MQWTEDMVIFIQGHDIFSKDTVPGMKVSE